MSVLGEETTIPDAVGPIVAVRAWGCTRGRLVPVVGPYPIVYGNWDSWDLSEPTLIPWVNPGIQTADCRRECTPPYRFPWEHGFLAEHTEVPYIQCRCGFWGVKNPTDLVLQLSCDRYGTRVFALSMHTASSFPAFVLGEVELWGRVVVGTRGYRASHAQVKALVDSPHFDVTELAKFYGVPVIGGLRGIFDCGL